MSLVNITAIVPAANLADAQQVCVNAGDGPGQFTVPIAYASRGEITDPAQADWFGMTGPMEQAEADALNQAINLNVHVFPNDPNMDPLTQFEAHLAACDPPLRRIIPGL